MPDYILLRNGTRIPKRLFETIMSATSHDLAFGPTKLETHSLSKEEKTGFTLVGIKGHKLTDVFPVTYVRVEDEEGCYYYVYSRLASPEQGNTYLADSEVEAQRKLLAEIKAYLAESTKT
jgi:hypothetical protein